MIATLKIRQNLTLAATLLGSVLLWTPCAAQETSAPRTMTAHRVAGSAPVIDGRLDDNAWKSAEVVTNFVQEEPSAGAAATQRTTASILYDDAAIYVAMRMYDTHPDSIRAPLSRRDDTDAPTEWAAVAFDSNHDRRTAYVFLVTPKGVQADKLLYEDVRGDENWDAVWEVSTRIDSEGWTAEFRIPLSQLRYSVKPNGEAIIWGVEFSRVISRRSETSHWSPIVPGTGRYVSQFGTLAGLDGLAVSRRVEVMPYTLGRVTREPGESANPFYSSNKSAASVGADLKLGLTPSLTLTATINPDFGQVEADPSVVNLGSFETFYPEKRPFFTEGAEIFRFRLGPEADAFYSRRVGRAPQRSVDAPNRGYIDAPGTSRILGAAKISGKTASGWSVGLLHAITGATGAQVSDSLAVITTEPTEPTTHYSAARLVRDFRAGQSGLGAVFTSTFRQIDDSRLDFLKTRAMTTGVNGYTRFARNQWEARMLTLGTFLGGSRQSIALTQRNSTHRFQRPDGNLVYDTTLTGMSGWANETGVRKIAGSWTGGMTLGIRSPGFDVNDAGYNSYSDTWFTSTSLNYRSFKPGKYVRKWNNGISLVPAWTFSGQRFRASGEYNLSVDFSNLWDLDVHTTRWQKAVSPFVLRGGPALMTEAYTEGRVRVGSDRRRRVSGELETYASYSENRAERRVSLTPALVIRPTLAATISIAPSATWNRDDDQYIRTSTVNGTKHYLTGHLEQTTAELTARVSYAFTPDLSLDAYVQPFLSSGHYSTIREVVSPHAKDFDQRFSTFGTDRLSLDPSANRYTVRLVPDGSANFSFGNPDFSVRELQANTVLRWRYRPGSTLFLVWSQARDNDDLASGLPVRRELDRLFSVFPRNVFLLKVSYWLGR